MKGKAIIGFVAILIAIVGLTATAYQPQPGVILSHGGEIGRGIVRDGETRAYAEGGGFYFNGKYYINGAVIPALKGINNTFTVNTTTYAQPVSQVYISWGDHSDYYPFGATLTMNWTHNGTYPVYINITHTDGYYEELYYTAVVFDNYTYLYLNVSGIPEDILNNTFVYLFHSGIYSGIPDLTEKTADGLGYKTLTDAKLNMLGLGVVKTLISNIDAIPDPTGVNSTVYIASFYYMNASQFYVFAYNPAIISDTVYSFTLDDIATGNMPTVKLQLRNTSLKLTQIFEGDFTSDFNTLYVMPSFVDYEGGPQQRLLWDNYGEYIGVGKLDGNFNMTEAEAVAGAINRDMLAKLTGSEFIPDSFEDGVVVDSTAIYNFAPGTLKVAKIEGVGKYTNTTNRTFSIDLNATYHTDNNINQTVNQHIVKITIPPDTEYWDRKVIIHFRGWNISHIEVADLEPTTRAYTSTDDMNITYTNDTVIVDPSTTAHNITIYLYREVSEATSGAVSTIEETAPTLWDRIMAYKWYIAAAVVVGGIVIYARRKKGRGWRK